jgi:hypothetical protein
MGHWLQLFCVAARSSPSIFLSTVVMCFIVIIFTVRWERPLLLFHLSNHRIMSTFLFTSESVNEGHPGTFRDSWMLYGCWHSTVVIVMDPCRRNLFHGSVGSPGVHVRAPSA